MPITADDVIATIPDVADLVRALLAEDGAWPKHREKHVLTNLNTWAALREGDKEQLVKASGVASYVKDKSKYRVDGLPDRMADAWAHYLFGQEPQFLAATPGDQDLLDELIPNLFASELEEAASVAVSEGETWGRIYTEDGIDRPQLDWVSRRDVFPLWAGRRLRAAAIVTEFGSCDACRRGSAGVHRMIEVHAVGVVVNLLFCGNKDKIGDRVPLEHHGETYDLQEAWVHNLPFMLVERIPNRIRRTRKTGRTVGISDYAVVLDTLLDLNEAASIGASNMRLSARKRAIISAAAAAAGSAVQGAGPGGDLDLTPEEGGSTGSANRARFTTDEEIFVDDPLDAEMGGSGVSPFRILEYTFDAEPLIAWRRELVDTALSRTGLTGQYVGVGEAAGVGYAISGTALRLRLIPTDSTGEGKARYWVDGVPRLLRKMAAVDYLPVTEGGFGRGWTELQATPTMIRRPGLPTDDVEQSTMYATLLTAGGISAWQVVKDRNPSWDDDQIREEVDRIKADRGSTMPSSFA